MPKQKFKSDIQRNTRLWTKFRTVPGQKKGLKLVQNQDILNFEIIIAIQAVLCNTAHSSIKKIDLT